MKKLQRQFFRTEASLWTLLLTVQRQWRKWKAQREMNTVRERLKNITG